MEGLITSSDLEGNIKTSDKNKQKSLPGELALFTPIIISVIGNIRNIKCKCPDFDAIYRYISKIVATNVDRDFIETIVELDNKNMIFNNYGLDPYFIVNAKENSDVTNSTIANENVNSNSNIRSDINKSSSNENTPDKIHTDNTEKEKAIQNSASSNENFKFFHNISKRSNN